MLRNQGKHIFVWLPQVAVVSWNPGHRRFDNACSSPLVVSGVQWHIPATPHLLVRTGHRHLKSLELNLVPWEGSPLLFSFRLNFLFPRKWTKGFVGLFFHWHDGLNTGVMGWWSCCFHTWDPLSSGFAFDTAGPKGPFLSLPGTNPLGPRLRKSESVFGFSSIGSWRAVLWVSCSELTVDLNSHWMLFWPLLIHRDRSADQVIQSEIPETKC